MIPYKIKDISSYTITRPAKREEIPVMTSFVGQIMQSSGFSNMKTLEVEHAVEEACTNISLYAYPQGNGEMTVNAFDCEDKIVVVIEDRGVPFDPTARLGPISTAGVEERPIGGLGIYLMTVFLDKISYEHKDGKNVLTMTKLKG